jgi:hypothetical protein
MALPTVPILSAPGRLTKFPALVSVSPYPSEIGRPAAAKKCAISWLSGAAPETSTRIRPPSRAWSLLKTSFSASP